MTEMTAEVKQTNQPALTDGNTPSEQDLMRAQARENLSISVTTACCVSFLGLFFLYCSYLPVYHTDIWGHVSYGKWILANQQLPVEDPFVPLAGGMDLIDNAWLSQVLYASLARQSGVHGLSDAYAAICLFLLIGLITTFSLRTKHLVFGVLAALGTWGMIVFRLSIIRPELLGSLCFALLLAQTAFKDRALANESDRQRWHWEWLTIPATFTLWGNLHGSYIVGIAFLGCGVAGATWDAVTREKSIKRVWTDPQFRSELLLFQLSLLAVCINPYGIDLLLQTVLFPTHPNLKSVMEWFPLEMKSLEGIPMALSWIAAAFVIRLSRAKFAARDVLILLLLSVAVCMRVRMIAWYAPIYFFVMAPHFADCFRQLGESPAISRCGSYFQFMKHRSIHASLLAGFALYLAFAFSPISRHVMGGGTRADETVYSHQTPVKLSQFLNEHPPQGLIYAPQWWGDWLIYDSTQDLQVFVSTNTIHLVPETVWKHYLAISKGRSGFISLLDRYRINTMVVSKDLQPSLEKTMSSTTGWNQIYEDEISSVFTRVTNAGDSPAATAH